MPRLAWDLPGEKVYETGVDHGVLYEPDSTGVYASGVPWNGLVNVNETPSGAEANPQYADNIKYLNLYSAEEFGATIEAFTYPDEFLKYDGGAEIAPGVVVSQQNRRPFGFSYRTLIGNDLLGTDYGYKLHCVYGAQASPSEKGYGTVNDSPEAITFSWELTTTPIPVDIAGQTYKPTAIVTIDSTKTSPAAMAALEDILYGTDSTEARLPTPAEIAEIVGEAATIEVTPTAPTQTGNDVSIPTVTGVVYQMDGSPVTGTVTLTQNETITAVPASGYHFPSGATTMWNFTFTP